MRTMEKPWGGNHGVLMSAVTFNQLHPNLLCGKQLALAFMGPDTAIKWRHKEAPYIELWLFEQA